MSSYSFAQEFPGDFSRGQRRKHHHHHHHHEQGRRAAIEAFLETRGGPRGEAPGGEGPFAGPHGPFGRGGFGGPGRGRGRGRGRARRGDVRLALLRLLAEEPRNGYQLMQTIEERSDGQWRPSPGSVYPTLSQLEDEGLVRSTEAEGARRFEITDAGREHLETRSEEADPWVVSDDEPGLSGRDTKRLIGAIAEAAMMVASVGSADQQSRAGQLLSETRRSLYRILAEDSDSEA